MFTRKKNQDIYLNKYEMRKYELQVRHFRYFATYKYIYSSLYVTLCKF